MFNLKISGIAAGTAFIFSVIIGMISRSSFPVLILRALAFSALFFVISGFIRVLVSRFLPELLEEGGMDDTVPRPGSRINITEGNDYYQGISPEVSQEYPKPSVIGAQPDDSEDGLGNISDLLGRSGLNLVDNPGTGMDQNGPDGYTDNGELGAPSAAYPGKGQADGDDVNIPASVDVLPDLESMAGAFSPATGYGDSETTEYSVSAPAKKPSLKDKAPEWSGDFNAKELAAGLRTILNKEKEG